MTQMLPVTKPLNLAWMTGWCVAAGSFGMILAGGGFEATSAPVRALFDVLNDSGELNLNPYLRFSLAVLGAVTIGWSVTLMSVVQVTNQLEKQVSQRIWIGMTASIVIWYVIDSSLSIITGFWLNAVLNTVFSATFLLPVVRSGVLRG